MDNPAHPKSMLESLRPLTPAINPAVRLWWELSRLEAAGQLTLEDVLLHQHAINAAINQGRQEIEDVNGMTRRLSSLSPIPQPFPILPL